MAVQNLRIKIRRDEFANWENINPILYLAEQGYETDTRKMKIGDGRRRYLDLPYFGETLETIDGFLVTDKVQLMTRTKFLIRDLTTFDGKELETQQDANIFILENLIKQEKQIQDIIDGGLDDDFVKTSGDTMSGSLRIVEQDGYRYNISERSIDDYAGHVTIDKDGDIKYESFYTKQDNVYVIDVKDPSVPNPFNAIEISGTEVVVGRDLDVMGDLFVKGVNILDHLTSAPEYQGQLNKNFSRKYDKTGGPISGPVVIFPAGGDHTQAVFMVNSGGVFILVEPTDPRHAVTKGYVDRTKMPYDITKLKRLSNVQSFIG